MHYGIEFDGNSPPPPRPRARGALLLTTRACDARQTRRYAQIAKTLEVPESEVEKWVVNAVKLGLLQAKMDQLRKVVLVSQYMHRRCEQILEHTGALRKR